MPLYQLIEKVKICPPDFSGLVLFVFRLGSLFFPAKKHKGNTIFA